MVLYRWLKFEPNVCDQCYDVLIAYELKSIEILNVKGVNFRCILGLMLGVNFRCISRGEAVNRLNNSVLEDKGVL